METIIAACGLVCSRCDAYRATRENDAEKLALVAADWRLRYQTDAIKSENVRCNGCMTEGGPKCGHCDSMCGIRKCVREKGHSTCAQCAEFPCGQLSELYGYMGDQGHAVSDFMRSLRLCEKAMHSAF